MVKLYVLTFAFSLVAHPHPRHLGLLKVAFTKCKLQVSIYKVTMGDTRLGKRTTKQYILSGLVTWFFILLGTGLELGLRS